MQSAESTGSLFLLAFTALFSIINPLGGAFIFLSMTRQLERAARKQLATWVAIHSFMILCASLYIGAYVLEFFGISLPVLRTAGGIVIAASAWKMLNATDDPDRPSENVVARVPTNLPPSRVAFYPLTMPITTGPGTISVAVSLGANRPQDIAELRVLSFFAQTFIAAVLVCALIFLLYRNADRLSGMLGGTGSTIVMRLSAFLLFCIGISVLWSGIAELVATL